MATTRAALRNEIDSHLRLVHAVPSVTSTATGGSTTTVIDTTRSEADDFWNNSWLYVSDTTDGGAPKDEEALVADFSASNDTFTLSGALSAAVGAGDTYELRRYFSAAMIHSAINLALEDAQYQLRVEAQDESLVVQEDTLEYTLPDAVEFILRIDCLEHTIDYRGTATGGGADTLEDTGQNWTTDSLAGMEVAIYDGTGSGQYRTIASNTSDTATVTVAWTTEPDATSKYVIKDLSEPCYRHRVTHANVVGHNLYLREFLPRGQRLLITHVPTHTDLDADDDTTEVPKTYVVLRATQHLMLMAPAVLPEALQAQAHRIHDRLEIQVMRYLSMNKRTEVPGTYWNRGGHRRVHWYIDSSVGIGTKEEL